MKALARRLKGVFGLALCTGIGIAMTWSQALGQSTPDVVAIPEPSSLLAMATGAAVVAFVTARRRK